MISQKLTSLRELSKEVEKKVLSPVVVEYTREKALDILSRLKKEDFEHYSHVYEMVKEAVETNNTFDTIFESERYKGKVFVSDFVKYKYLTNNETEKSIDELRRISLAVKYIKATSNTIDSVDYKNIEGHISNFVGDLASMALFQDNKTNSKKGINEVEKIQDEFKNKKEEHLGLSTGFSAMDNMTEGFIKGNLIIIGGYAGVGKTSFMLNAILNVLKTGKSVVLYSLEMNSAEVFAKLIGIESGVNYVKILKGYLTPEEEDSVNEAKAIIYETKLTIYDDLYDMEQIKVSMIKEGMGNVDLFVLDYIQLLKSEKYKTLYDRVSNAATDLKLVVAKKTGVPVVAISSISNADVRTQSDELGGYKGSGDIEYTANVAMKLLNVDDRETRDSNKKTRRPNYVDCVITKSRHGVTGAIQMSFYGYTGRIKEGRDSR